MHSYDDDIADAREYFEALRQRGREQLEAEYGPCEPIEADEDDADDEADDGLNEFGFRPYIAATGERIAFEAFPLEELEGADRIDAMREANGWKFWRQDPDGQRWYVQSGSVPPGMIHGVSESIGGDYD
jgi:hypothetical protein